MYRPASLEAEGFIHLSTEEQWLRVAHTFYRGRTDLILLEIDDERLAAELRFDAVGGERFPHLYGPLEVGAVVNRHPLRIAGDGDFRVPEGVTGIAGPRAP